MCRLSSCGGVRPIRALRTSLAQLERLRPTRPTRPTRLTHCAPSERHATTHDTGEGCFWAPTNRHPILHCRLSIAHSEISPINFEIDGTNYRIDGTNYLIDGTNFLIGGTNSLIDGIDFIFDGINWSNPSRQRAVGKPSGPSGTADNFVETSHVCLRFRYHPMGFPAEVQRGGVRREFLPLGRSNL